MVLEFFRSYLLSRSSSSLVRVIAILSIVGVAVGVFALVVVTAVMNGFHASIRKNLLSSEPHVVFEIEPPARPELTTGADQFSVSSETAEQARQWLTSALSQSAYSAEILSQDLVLIQDFVVKTTDGVFSGVEARGLGTEALSELLERVQSASQIEEMLNQDVLLGYDLAKGLGVSYGDRLTVLLPESLVVAGLEAPRFERVIVRSLLETQVSDIDGRLFLFDRTKSLLSLRGSRSAKWRIEYQLRDPGKAAQLKTWIASEIEQARLASYQLKVTTWETRNASLFYALRLELFAIGAFLVLSTLIAGFSIVTVLTILLSQKQKEIGLLMSLGMSSREVRSLFTAIGGMLGSLGAFLGTVFGLFVCWVIDSNPSQILPDFYYDTTVPARPNPIVVTSVLAGGIGFSLLASYLGARRATQLTPAEALTSRHRNRAELQSATS